MTEGLLARSGLRHSSVTLRARVCREMFSLAQLFDSLIVFKKRKFFFKRAK